MEAAAGAGAGAGTSGDCEGEDQEDSSSSSHLQDALNTAVGNLTLQDNKGDKYSEGDLQGDEEHEFPSSPKEVFQETEPQDEGNKVEDKHDELSAFRLQWQRELESTLSPQKTAPKKVEEEPQTDEERAMQLFLKGVELERERKLYEAIQNYKRAMQILPDVETRLYESYKRRAETPEEESETEEPPVAEEEHPSDDEDAVEGEELLARLRRIVTRRGYLCEPAVPTKSAHMSWLPFEVILLIIRWVVSSDLDALSLERLSGVCRGLYVAAREPDVWRALCVKTWGIECSRSAWGCDSWRAVFVRRPRLQLHGCYISKTTYLRHGENSFQDQFYRPWYLIDYYRYLRFFPEGLVLMWTTAEEPAACVGQLRSRAARPGAGILAGHYRFIDGDKVVIIIKKALEKKAAAGGNTRFRARRREPQEAQEQIFHLELELHSIRSRRNCQLTWSQYAVSTRRDQWTQFELSPGKFPPFSFSRVRQYTAEAHAPLQLPGHRHKYGTTD